MASIIFDQNSEMDYEFYRFKTDRVSKTKGPGWVSKTGSVSKIEKVSKTEWESTIKFVLFFML